MQVRHPGRFHYSYFRDYDPAVGRYVQSQFGLAGGLNTYAYVDADPGALRGSARLGSGGRIRYARSSRV